MMDYPARTIAVPAGHAAFIYPVPAITDSTTDDGAAIIDAATHVVHLIDDGEDG